MIVLMDSRTGEVVFDGRRVSRAHRCPVCGKDTWCVYDPQRGAAICPRVESDRRIGDAGWMHKGDSVPKTAVFEKQRAELLPMDGGEAAQARYEAQGAARLPLLALSLGLSRASLRRLGAGWNGSAWTFPMRNARREIVGFRTRGEDGSKFAIKGSRAGVFIPEDLPRGGTIWVVEGPTDVAAMLDMDLPAVGRASCMGQEEEIARCVMPYEAVHLVADADEVGVRGALRLSKTIGRRSRVMLPPLGLKDARQVLNFGGGKSDWMGLQPVTSGQRSTSGRTT
jgi:hypothetical protein